MTKTNEEARPDKVAVVDEVRELLKSSDATILTEYRGMSVKQLGELRGSLRSSGTQYRVFKNTLVKIAADQAGIEGLEPLLHGPTAVAFVSGDAVEAAKALRDAAKTNPLLILKGGVLGTKVLDAKQLDSLADMPPRAQVLAELAGLLEAPMSQFASLLAAVPRDLVYAIANLIEKQGGAPDDAPTDTTPDDAPAADAA